MKAGPKAPVTAGPLDLSMLPEARDWRRVQAFALEFLRIPKGAGAKEPFKLHPWQVSILKGLYPARGARPRQGLLSMPRGQGKSALAAVLALYGLFGDEVESAQVLVVASDERQANIVFAAAARMIELDERLADQVQMYRDRIVVPNTGSEMRPLPAAVDALQGWDPSVQIVDELAVVTPDVWEAVTSAAGKRPQSLTLAISTPADSPESIMWKLVEHGRQGGDSSYFYKEFAAPDGCDLDDEKAWRLANPAIGSGFKFIDAMRATRRTMREPAFRRYHLGMWVGQDSAWMPWGQWESCSNPAREVREGERVVLAFDGSASGDSTALMGCTIDDPHLFVVGLWEDTGDRGWRVPREEVDTTVISAFEKYDVVELAADPWGWRESLERWSKKFGERKVIEYNTAYAGRMAPATDRLYQGTATKSVTHDGDSRLAAHVANAVAKSTSQGDLIYKDKKGSPRKIDAAIASIVAYDRAAFHANKATKRRAVSFR